MVTSFSLLIHWLFSHYNSNTSFSSDVFASPRWRFFRKNFVSETVAHLVPAKGTATWNRGRWTYLWLVLLSICFAMFATKYQFWVPFGFMQRSKLAFARSSKSKSISLKSMLHTCHGQSKTKETILCESVFKIDNPICLSVPVSFNCIESCDMCNQKGASDIQNISMHNAMHWLRFK